MITKLYNEIEIVQTSGTYLLWKSIILAYLEYEIENLKTRIKIRCNEKLNDNFGLFSIAIFFTR